RGATPTAAAAAVVPERTRLLAEVAARRADRRSRAPRCRQQLHAGPDGDRACPPVNKQIKHTRLVSRLGALLAQLSCMLTLLDINRALDRLGPLAFVPRTRPELAMYVSMAPSRPNRGRSEKNLARPPGRARSMSAQRRVEGGDT